MPCLILTGKKEFYEKGIFCGSSVLSYLFDSSAVGETEINKIESIILTAFCISKH